MDSANDGRQHNLSQGYWLVLCAAGLSRQSQLITGPKTGGRSRKSKISGAKQYLDFMSRKLREIARALGPIIACVCGLAILMGFALLFRFSVWLGSAGVVGIYALGWTVVTVDRIIRRWFEGRRPCRHGVRSGAAGNCQACLTDAAWAQNQREIEAQERIRKKHIAEEAEALRHREVERLSKAWLTNSESYFNMDAQEFENAVAQIFKRLGYRVEQTPFSNDRGKDAIAWKDGNKYLIECKRYGENQGIGRRDLQIFRAAMLEERAVGGIYVNTGRFARTAVEYAPVNDIELYDRKKFSSLVNQAYPVAESAKTANVMCSQCGLTSLLPVGTSSESGTCSNGHTVTNDIIMADFSVFDSLERPKCVKCGSDMRIVKGYRGEFWGCTEYPRCKSSQPISPHYRGRRRFR